MKKRIIALLLTVVMICALLPVSAFAAGTNGTEITAVDICGLTNPKVGAKLDYDFTVSSTPEGSVTASGKNAPEVVWKVYNPFTEQWDKITDKEYVGIAGKQYRACIYMTAASGYDFSYTSGSQPQYSGSIRRDGVTSTYTSAYQSGSKLCVEIFGGRLPVDSANKVYDLTFKNLPYYCVIGDSVADFKPATLTGDGDFCEYFWFLLKYAPSEDGYLDDDAEPAGIYIAKDQTDIALKFMPELSKASIAVARDAFGSKFEEGYVYVLTNVQILKDGYAYGADEIHVHTYFTDGDVQDADMEIDKNYPAAALPIYLTPVSVTYPDAPTLSISKTDGKIKLSWYTVPGADKYWIYRSTDGTNFKYYDTTYNTTYTNSSVTSGTKYYYKVKAVNHINDKDYSSSYSSAKSTIPLTTPKLTVSLSAGSAKLSWNAVTGATKYWIYRSTDGKNFKYYDSTTKTTYTNSSVTADGTYYYKVKAIKTVNGTDWTSDYSAAKSVKILKAPTLSIAKTDGKIKLSWNAVDGAAKYWIYRSTDGTNYKYYDTTTKTTYTNSSVTSGTKYYYKVKAANADGGASVYSSAKSTVPIKTPVLAGELNDGKVKLSWGAVDGAAKYWIYRSTDGENFKLYDSTTKTTYTNSSVTEGTTYYYKIKAAKTIGSTDWASDFSNLISIDR